MNKNSNTYIILYSTVMVVVVATLLAVASLSLKDRQDANVRVEKMGDILRSVGKAADADKAKDKIAYIQEQYEKYITESLAVNSKGEVVEGADAFTLLTNLKAEYDKPSEERVLPIFASKDDDGTVRYIIPVWGTGLWGPIWGYIALDGDWNTISGVVFDHKGETPGLGAEIAMPQFTEQFKNKEIFEKDNLVGVKVVKGGAPAGDLHAVDAVSGGTITSRGVENMLKGCLADYKAYIDIQRAALIAAPAQEEAIDPVIE